MEQLKLGAYSYTCTNIMLISDIQTHSIGFERKTLVWETTRRFKDKPTDECLLQTNYDPK